MDIRTVTHDDDRWGAAFSRGEPRTPLTRLADLVLMLTTPAVPVAEAAGKLIDALRAAGDIAFFMCRPGHRADWLTNTAIWRVPTSGNLVDLPPCSERIADDLWTVRRDDSPYACDQWNPAADLAGFDGLFACLTMSWCSRLITNRADLDKDLAARIAISSEQATSLLRYLQTSPPEQVFRTSEPPTDERLASRRSELAAVRPRLQAQMQLMVAEFGLNERTIQRRIKSHKDKASGLAKGADLVNLVVRAGRRI